MTQPEVYRSLKLAARHEQTAQYWLRNGRLGPWRRLRRKHLAKTNKLRQLAQQVEM